MSAARSGKEIAKFSPRSVAPAASADSASKSPAKTAAPVAAAAASPPPPPVALASTPTKSPTANRFSSTGRASPVLNSPRSPGGGSILYVAGVGKSPARGEGQSSVFRSGSSIADAHIKSLASHVTAGGYFPAATISPRGGTAAFRSTSPSDRDSHIRDVAARFNGQTLGSDYSPSRRSQPDSFFRSASPTACAHIVALGKPVDASYNVVGYGAAGGSPSAVYRSQTSIADAHIKALPKFNEAPCPDKPHTVRTCSSPFKSGTSIADAHIKALPKPVDTLLAYKE